MCGIGASGKRCCVQALATCPRTPKDVCVVGQMVCKESLYAPIPLYYATDSHTVQCLFITCDAMQHRIT